MILNEFFNLPQVFEKDMTNGDLNEFAPGGSGDSGDYLRALASAWYNDAFDTGSLQKGIKSQQDVERLLNRGIVCPDGVTRKLHIDYNSDFDGVEIYSDDYYEHGDESGELDSRTGQPWGPYDHMEFKDEELDEGVAEGSAQDSKSWMASIRQQHPDVKFVQAKMPGAPIMALVNGKPVAQFDTKKGVSEGTEETPFGSVSHNDTPVKPQQYHYGTEPSDKEIRKQRLQNVRQRKQDLLKDYAQMGALRVELIHGINNDVFLNKDQLLDYFDHLVDDPELTPLEYAHENGIPTDGLLKGMLRRAAQLGVSALDVRKLFASAKAKQGVAEGMFDRQPNPVLPMVDKIAKVAGGLTPQNVEVGKQIIQANARDITRMLSPQSKAGVDVIEGTRERLSNLHDKIRKQKDLPNPKEYLKIAQQKKKEIADLKAQDKKEVGEGKGDYVPPKEADYGEKYQAMVKRVGQKAKQQEKAKQPPQPKQPVRESRRALLKQIIQS